jgi:hypothetical protein
VLGYVRPWFKCVYAGEDLPLDLEQTKEEPKKEEKAGREERGEAQDFRR